MFSIGNGPRRYGHYRSCFSIPIESILLLLGSNNKGIVVWRSPISSVAPSSSALFTNLHYAPSSSAPFTNLQCYASTRVALNSTVALLQLNRSSVAPFDSYYFIPCDYATHQFYIIDNLATMWIHFVDYLTASLKYKFLQLQNMLPPIDAFILLSWFSFIN